MVCHRKPPALLRVLHGCYRSLTSHTWTTGFTASETASRRGLGRCDRHTSDSLVLDFCEGVLFGNAEALGRAIAPLWSQGRGLVYLGALGRGAATRLPGGPSCCAMESSAFGIWLDGLWLADSPEASVYLRAH